MDSFRVIALRVLDGCEPHIRRALKEEVTYFLCNDYEDQYKKNGEWITITKKNKEDGELPKNFFALPENKGLQQKGKKPTINISAIVGKNGDGKSSLVELMLRIINNFSVTYGFREDQESLAQIQGVEALLYYEIDGNLYSIKCSQGNSEASFTERGDKETLKLHQNALFYTIVANYSIYAYNSKNFEQEVDNDNDCWINGVFHKNDSYQTPLVLNPMRTEGNFDVNREEDLCRQRLMALYVDSGNDSYARKINDNKIATGFAFNLEEKSKLETSTLYRYFLSTWKSTALMRVTLFFEGILLGNKTSKQSIVGDSFRTDFDLMIQFWLHYSDYWDKYRSLFELAEKVIEQIYEDNNADYYVNEATDLKLFLKTAEKTFKTFVKNEKEKKKLLKSLESVSSLTQRLTGLQFQRLVLIMDVCEFWSKHPWFSKDSFSSDIQQYVDGENKSVVEQSRARLYIIYKTISIISQYKQFHNIFNINQSYFYLFDFIYDDEYKNRLPLCLKSLFTDNEQQHIDKKYNTLKLRQTINYLRYHSFTTSRTHDIQTKSHFGLSNFITFSRLQELIQKAKKKSSEETIALLPPPIFEGEILVREGEDRAGFPRFKMSDLSSGELQMLNSISTYIYHLRNLNYRLGAKGFVEFSFVNLILEEVELYFHPEFQRQYVYRMLEQIEQVNLSNIKAINIILVTHSPFVLTDVPKNNVLFLKDGKPVHVMQENTFGANIHALLQNGFFLDGVPMGEFANKKINKMFERLHKGDYSDELYEEIKLVSEPLLKTQLYRLFALNKLPFDNDPDAKKLYGDLLKRVKQLEDTLNGEHQNI